QVNQSTVHRIREKFVTEGLETAINRKVYPSRTLKISGDEEAHLIAISCSNPPEGRAKWTLSLLADALIQMKIVETVSSSTIGRALKKMS
ncbi:MAG: helix-turn-helix domain-containing protein, partial [Nitrososphaeraceae archaeon]